MSKQSIDASAHMEGAPQSEQSFPVEREYARCVTALNRTGMLTLLPKSESIGVIGIDGKEYPIPTQEQVVTLFAYNRELVGREVPQGFDRLELTPMAMPTPLLLDRMKAALLKHAAEGTINEYLQILQMEDFLTKFLTHLETTNEVSNDVDDNNAIWCLAQYLKVSYAELVPTGRWYRSVGRARLDMHRTNNKLCTKSWGGSSTVRLLKP